jgi:antitoxin MazE
MYLHEDESLRGAAMRAQVLRWGNSLAVRIPKPVADQANLKEGDPLEIEVAASGGSVQLHRAGKIPTLAELVAQITPENRYAEISAGSEVGKEVVEW